MRVDVRVIFADLPNKVLSCVFSSLQESLIDLKDLFLDLFGRVYVKHARQGDQQELFVMRLGRGQANRLEHSINAAFNLRREAFLIEIINDCELRVAHP